jgi:hypothetical protein
MKTTSSQILDSKYYSLGKGTRLLEERNQTPDSRAGIYLDIL